jgi:hypothetical protein
MFMQKLMAAVVSLLVSGFALAATPVDATHAKKKVQTKQAAKPVAARSNTHIVKVAPLVAAVPVVAAVVTDPKQQDVIADLVHTGRMVCELGNFVTVTPDPESSTHFIVQMKKNTYRMSPVETTTGAVRLEDAQAGAMWLQLQNKSMLMNSKLGQRMADECQSPNQMAVAEAMKLAPPPSLLDVPTLAKK